MKRLTIISLHHVGRESGAALIVGLIMLLLLTIIGLSAMQGVTMQEKMSGNERDTIVALQSAEVGLRYAEDQFLNTLDEVEVGKPFVNCLSNCFIVDSRGSTDVVDALKNNPSSWESVATDYGDFKDISGNTISPPNGTGMGTHAAIPKLTIEYVVHKADAFDTGTGVVDDTGLDLYRTSVKASGSSGDSEAVLQTIYARRFR